MEDFDLIQKRFLQQDEFIDHLRAQVEALEGVLKNHVPNFEEQYARKLVLIKDTQKKRIQRHRDGLDD